MVHADRKRLRQALTRHGRRKTGLILCEGVRACREALSRRPDWLQAALFSESFADHQAAEEFASALSAMGSGPEIVPDIEFQALAATENPQGIILLLQRAASTALTVPVPDPFILILDQIGEPGNLGTILRTAWAAGLQEVWITEGSTDPFGPKAIRAGMGAQFALECRIFPDLEQVHEKLQFIGYPRLWLSSPHQGISCYDESFDLQHCGLVIGSEATGVSAMAAGEQVRIPMPGHAESLNAAQAATILIFEAVRRGILRS